MQYQLQKQFQLTVILWKIGAKIGTAIAMCIYYCNLIGKFEIITTRSVLIALKVCMLTSGRQKVNSGILTKYFHNIFNRIHQSRESFLGIFMLMLIAGK